MIAQHFVAHVPGAGTGRAFLCSSGVRRPADAGQVRPRGLRGLGADGGAFAEALWQETGVAVLDAGAFGAAARGWVRIAFTLDEARLAEACARIAGFARKRVGR